MLNLNQISLKNKTDNFVFDQCNNLKDKTVIIESISQLTNYSPKYINFLSESILTKIEDMTTFQFKRVEAFIYNYWDKRLLPERLINSEIETLSDFLSKQ